jgi:hypothetical protein
MTPSLTPAQENRRPGVTGWDRAVQGRCGTTDDETARAVLQRVVAQARASGAPAVLPFALACLCEVVWRLRKGALAYARGAKSVEHEPRADAAEAGLRSTRPEREEYPDMNAKAHLSAIRRDLAQLRSAVAASVATGAEIFDPIIAPRLRSLDEAGSPTAVQPPRRVAIIGTPLGLGLRPTLLAPSPYYRTERRSQKRDRREAPAPRAAGASAYSRRLTATTGKPSAGAVSPQRRAELARAA